MSPLQTSKKANKEEEGSAMQNTKANAKARIFTAVKIAVMVLFWGGILLFWWKYRKEISVESITNFVPGNIAAAIVVMLLLFPLQRRRDLCARIPDVLLHGKTVSCQMVGLFVTPV